MRRPARAVTQNSKISPSAGRVSRTKAYKKKGGYKHTDRKGVKAAVETPAASTSKSLKKGGDRSVPTAKASRFYPSEDVAVPKQTRKVAYPAHLRKSITPGTVLILLAGRFRGKRVVFLKQLESGLLLVTGPFKVNGVPIRRVNQAYVIATSTKLDIGSVQVDAKLNDSYFARAATKGAKPEASFFADPANKEAHPAGKAADQKALDKALLAAISPVQKKYLAATFSLSNGTYPHNMRF